MLLYTTYLPSRDDIPYKETSTTMFAEAIHKEMDLAISCLKENVNAV